MDGSNPRTALVCIPKCGVDTKSTRVEFEVEIKVEIKLKLKVGTEIKVEIHFPYEIRGKSRYPLQKCVAIL